MKISALPFLASLAALVVTARADSIVTSKHNLSATSPGSIKAVTESEICVFCHTPHNGRREAPLWNRLSSGQTYIPYSSTTAKAHPGQPTGDSKLCLSCHDGTIALGMVGSRGTAIPMQGGVTTLPNGGTQLGTDLANDHPISFTFDTALATADGQLLSPATLNGAVRLDGNGQLQCTTCHDPHNNRFGKFMTADNSASALCTTCHNKTYWAGSTHRTSTRTWNGVGTNPWPHTSYSTVQANGCENCHRPHTAGTKARLLNFPGEENNCYSCHNGNVATSNLQSEFTKASVHPISSTSGVHDPGEDPVNSTRHVECADCHNPHATNPGNRLAGVKGVSSAGTVVAQVASEAELCFRCHGDSTNRGPARVTRQFPQTNTRLEYQSTNASYHPLLAVGKNSNVPSLIAPWTTASRMSCSDCHNNNQGPGAGGTGPRGPHGSSYVPLLERRQELADNQPESSAIYALCYKCHSRSSILSDQSFRYHNKHIVGEKTACTTCHDSHGAASTTNLINFNTTYVTKSTSRNTGPTFTRTGTFRGTCTLTCHGEDHSGYTY